MERLPHKHLNLYELTLLVPDRTLPGTQLDVSDANRKELEDHLLSCPSCRELLEQERFLFHLSMRRQSKASLPVDSDCVSEERWMQIVAGQRPPEETQRQLEHALDCARCAALLKRFAEQFADESTAEEREILAGLASARPDWQKDLARQMQQQSAPPPLRQPEKKTWRKRGFLARFVLSVGSAAVLLSLAWWFAYRLPDQSVNRLLSEAYSAQRTMDLRMIGARYAAVEAFRGGEALEFRPPTALLEAEVLISKRLAAQPDNARWLDAQGRADLIDGNYSNALSSLERANRYEPQNALILIDLASAYFLRGEKLKRSEDYGRSVDLFGQVLARDPRNEIARFNRAIASERLLLYQQAMEDWKRYLELDPHSAWSEEARRRLQDLQEKLDLQKERSARPLLGPSGFLAALQSHDETSKNEVDLRVEPYFEVALSQWIPASLQLPPGSDAQDAREALEGFSQLLIAKHQDYWLSDFLNQLQHEPGSRIAIDSLENTSRSNEQADFDAARKSAVEATSLFRNLRNRPGELLARFESSYSDQLAHQVSDCLQEARARDDPRVVQRYPWLRIQLDLEWAACTNLNDETARQLASEALSLAKLHHYPSLELRSLTFLADLYRYMGDISSGWRYTTDGLSRYWQGDYPVIRGYSLYAELDYIAESAEEWFLDAQVLAEATEFDRGDPDVQVQALQSYRLAHALAMSGNLLGAEQSINNGRDLFLRSVDGVRKNNLNFEAQVALGKSELLCSHPLSAIHRLEPLEPEARRIVDADLAFDYFRNLGLAYFATGNSVRAKQTLTAAVGLADESLERNRDERERHMWCRKTDRVYRALEQLSLTAPPPVAFSQWEWFKGASVRGSPKLTSGAVFPKRPSPGENLIPEPFAPPPDTVVISYAVLPDETVAWTFNREGVTEHVVPISERDIDLLVHRFVDHCSRPDSKLTSILPESHLLYQKLIEPLEASLRGYTHLVIEPDQKLWLIPFAALLDTNSVYLADRFALSLSPGLEYLALSPPWAGVSRRSPILIAGDPPAMGRTPLEDAAQEAKGIAREFRYKKLLLQEDAGFDRIAEQMKDFEIFHFSGHAVASPDGVALLLGDSGVMDVARIRVSDASHLRLVVLSACHSAEGTDTVFDDRNSLARLLVGAGVAEVVASRWAVDSRATKILMEEFYSQLLSGAEVSLALRQASRRLRTEEEFRHPFYWAGFSAFGKS